MFGAQGWSCTNTAFTTDLQSVWLTNASLRIILAILTTWLSAVSPAVTLLSCYCLPLGSPLRTTFCSALFAITANMVGALGSRTLASFRWDVYCIPIFPGRYDPHNSQRISTPHTRLAVASCGNPAPVVRWVFLNRCQPFNWPAMHNINAFRLHLHGFRLPSTHRIYGYYLACPCLVDISGLNRIANFSHREEVPE